MLTYKNIAHQLIDQLPEGSTWNDAIYEMVVRREIDLGLEDRGEIGVKPILQRIPGSEHSFL